MVITEIGKSGIGLLLSVSGTYPRWIAVGTGSKNENANVTMMQNIATTQVFSSTDVSVPKYILWSADYNSTTMSGLNFKEFALMTGSPAQEPWHYVNLGNGVQFDGSNELRIELQWRVI